MSPTFRALAHRNYRLFALGGVVSNTGTWMQRVAQDWLIVTLATSTGTALGITTGLQFLPMLVLSPYAGLVADRFPKRKLLQVTQLMMAIPAVVLGVLAITGLVQVWHVWVIAFVFGIGTAFDATARQSFVSELVGREDLSNAVGLNSASFNAARLVGPGLAGVLIGVLGGGAAATGWVILLNGLSYAAVLFALRAMTQGELEVSPPAGHGKGMLRDVLRYLRSRPDLLLVLGVVFFVGTFGLNFQMTSALMATEVFHKGATQYGLLGSFMAIGSLAGALLAARREVIRLRLVVGAALAFAVIEIASGLMPTYAAFAAWVPLVGLSALTVITAANTVMQLSTSPQIRGRVMALYLMVFLGGTPLGAPIIGWVGEEFGARWTLIGGGAATGLGVVVCALAFGRQAGWHYPSTRGALEQTEVSTDRALAA